MASPVIGVMASEPSLDPFSQKIDVPPPDPPNPPNALDLDGAPIPAQRVMFLSASVSLVAPLPVIRFSLDDLSADASSFVVPVLFPSIVLAPCPLPGLGLISSGFGEPLYTKKSRLPPMHLGCVKVKVEILLAKSVPCAVVVEDRFGNSVRVDANYPHLPPKCEYCGEFVHQVLRCPQDLRYRSPFIQDLHGSSADPPPPPRIQLPLLSLKKK
ncbi:hypothetical protein EUTSA_v10017661mg, partial [Eutrema salsugineum]